MAVRNCALVRNCTLARITHVSVCKQCVFPVGAIWSGVNSLSVMHSRGRRLFTKLNENDFGFQTVSASCTYCCDDGGLRKQQDKIAKENINTCSPREGTLTVPCKKLLAKHEIISTLNHFVVYYEYNTHMIFQIKWITHVSRPRLVIWVM